MQQTLFKILDIAERVVVARLNFRELFQIYRFITVYNLMESRIFGPLIK